MASETAALPALACDQAQTHDALIEIPNVGFRAVNQRRSGASWLGVAVRHSCGCTRFGQGEGMNVGMLPKSCIISGGE